ncbi:MAG: transposase [Bacteroidales bacterium]|nr:transposase [Bacteroidales bacterium]
MTASGEWSAGDPSYLLPGAVLADKFRGKFLAYLRAGLTGKGRKASDPVLIPPPSMTLRETLNLLDRLKCVRWYVRIETAYPHAGAVLKYAGRYIRRGPLSERRILSYDGEQVSIAYAHSEKHTKNSFTLPASEFVRRVLDHVPERGTHCVRAYGLYHSACRAKLNQARKLLRQPPYDPEVEPPDTHELLHRMFPDFTGDLCPKCHARLVTIKVFRRGRSPPFIRFVA